jgi:tRNA dimethylallyltransferase
LPIVVGGTGYWLNALLFKYVLAEVEKKSSNISDEHQAVLDGPTEQMLEILTRVDPVMAARWHPNDRRKIRRSLELYFETGQIASDIYAEQAREHTIKPTDEPTDSLDCDPLIFWTYSPQDKLEPILRTRIDFMIENGLEDEVQELWRYRGGLSEPPPMDYGIWPTIGFKEWLPYIEAFEKGAEEDMLDKVYAESVYRTYIHTRQYAKSQVRWIRTQLLARMNKVGKGSQLFLLNASEPRNFENTVVKPASAILGDFIQYSPLPTPKQIAGQYGDMLNYEGDGGKARDRQTWSQRECKICGVVATLEHEWDRHINSNRHKRMMNTAGKVS